MKDCLKAILFTGILAGILFVTSIVLKAKWINVPFPSTEMWDGFYSEPDDSVDVVYIGSSHVMGGISPLCIWEETGLNGYICASTKLSVPASYLYLAEAIRRQHPAIAVFDMSRVFKLYQNVEYEEDTRRGLDYVHFSEEKVDVAETLMENDTRQSLFSYVFPITRYHSRWFDLTEEDFTYLARDSHMPARGQGVDFTISGFSVPNTFFEEREEDDLYGIGQDSVEYLEKMVELCKETGTELVFIKVPSYAWNYTMHEMAQEFADAYGISFIDYNMPDIRREIDFVSSLDFLDEGDHLNSYGAEKVSRHLGNWLKARYKIVKKEQTSENVQILKSDYDTYGILKEDAYLDNCEDLVNYLEALEKPYYITAIGSRFDASYYMTDDAVTVLRRYGLDADLIGKYKAGYAAVLEGGRKICESLEMNTTACCDAKFRNGPTISVSSMGGGVNPFCNIVIDGQECSEDKTGLAFAVYDKRIGKVVSKKRFNTHTTMYTYGTELKNSKYLRNYLEHALENPDYITCIETKGEISKEDRDVLSQWVEKKSDHKLGNADCATVIVCADGRIRDFFEDENKVHIRFGHTGFAAECTCIYTKPYGDDADIASVKIDGIGYSPNKQGINIVVYDRRCGRVVNSRCFNDTGK